MLVGNHCISVEKQCLEVSEAYLSCNFTHQEERVQLFLSKFSIVLGSLSVLAQ